MSDYINVTSNGNYNVTFSPAKFVTFDHNTIGVYKKIDVKAEGPWGAEDRCSFLVGTKGNNLNLKTIIENIQYHYRGQPKILKSWPQTAVAFSEVDRARFFLSVSVTISVFTDSSVPITI